MKVLVTGSEGYIGVMLTRVLRDEGFKVHGLDTDFYRSGWLYKDDTEEIATLKNKDVRDVSADDLKGFDAVIHLAELSNDPLGEINSDVTFSINHLGTVNLAKKSKEAGVKRFVYFSSCSVYGVSDDISDENSPLNPLTMYARCKVMNEKELSKMADDNFSPVFFRNATVYGPSPKIRFDLAVNNLSGLAWTTKEIKMQSDGKPWRPFVHILDVCGAVVAVLQAPIKSVHNQIFNVGDTNSNYQIREIAEIISTVFPGCALSFNKNSPDKRNYRVNFDKINSILPGFKCERNIEMGARELLKIFKEVNLNKEMFESKNFTRIKQLKSLIEDNQINADYFWK